MVRAVAFVLATLLLAQPPRDQPRSQTHDSTASGVIRGRVVSAATGDPIANAEIMDGTEGGGEWQDPAVLETLMPLATRVVLADAQQLTVSLRLIVR